MHEKPVPAAEFRKLVQSKPRRVRFTKHAEARSAKRFLPPAVFKRDWEDDAPVLVFEQECESKDERKFDVYFLQKAGFYHRYVLCLNNEIRLITLMRTSKDLQKFVAAEKK